MQPYQEASEEIRRQSEMPIKFAKRAAGTGLALAGVVPFLSPHIPESLAIKGLNKISPRIGKFIDKSVKGGYGFDKIRDFLSDKIKTEEESFSIRKNHPELAQEIEAQIKRGMNPLQAGATILASTGKNQKTAHSIQKKTGRNFEDIVSEEFQPTTEQTQPQAQQPQQKSDWSDLIAAIRNG